jgi:hypothetical protein
MAVSDDEMILREILACAVPDVLAQLDCCTAASAVGIRASPTEYFNMSVS